jgi:hypothetical protein
MVKQWKTNVTLDFGRNMWGSKTGIVDRNWKEITPHIVYNTNVMLQNFSVDVRNIGKLIINSGPLEEHFPADVRREYNEVLHYTAV